MGFEVNNQILVGVGVFTFAVFWVAWQFLRTPIQKLFLFLGIGGTWLLAGLGAAYEGSPTEYIRFYAIFLITLALAFTITLRWTSGVANRLADMPAQRFTALTQHPMVVRWILTAYFLLLLAPLLYPTLQIHKLWTPPRPDITSFTGLESRADLLEELIRYGRLLTFPFYLTSLYYFRRRYLWLAILVLLPSYLKLCTFGYIGRGGIVIGALMFVLIVWLDRREKRKLIAVSAVAGLPFFLYALFILGHLRADVDYRYQASTMGEAIRQLIFSQTSFPTLSGIVFDSGQTTDLPDYLRWLATTPIPKVFTGSLSDTRINYELAYLIRGMLPGDVGYTVDLTGVVTESVYIYGRNWFWLHAVFVGGLFGCLCTITERIPCTLAVSIHFAICWGYILNRAGIASAWPPLSNSFILFYFLLLHVCIVGGRTAPWRLGKWLAAGQRNSMLTQEVIRTSQHLVVDRSPRSRQ
jgi:hypothetical protein